MVGVCKFFFTNGFTLYKIYAYLNLRLSCFLFWAFRDLSLFSKRRVSFFFVFLKKKMGVKDSFSPGFANRLTENKPVNLTG